VARDLRLSELAVRAAADDIRLPQLTVLTLISEGPTPGEVLRGALGIEEIRCVGGLELMRASMGSRGYVVAAWAMNGYL